MSAAFRYSRRHINFEEVWFPDEAAAAAEGMGKGVDVRRLMFAQKSSGKANEQRFTTSHIDLTQDEATLLSEIKSGTRYEIRRAESKDNLVYEAWSRSIPAAISDEFATFFAGFAAALAIEPLDGEKFASQLVSGSVDLSRVSQEGRTLVWHLHFLGKENALLLRSASARLESADSKDRALVGRANRWHHWRDMLRFRAAGFKIYDFGGVAGSDGAKLAIAQFKEEFGGRRLDTFCREEAVSWRGFVYMKARDSVIAARKRGKSCES
jgi:hypothetical protein